MVGSGPPLVWRLLSAVDSLFSDAGRPVAGLERDKFDNKTVSFEEHIKLEHNIWNYLYFIVLVREKNRTDYTGPESYVAHMIKVGTGRRRVPAPPPSLNALLPPLQNNNLDWFPRMQAMSLVVMDGDGEQNEMRMLQDKLASTMKVVTTLTCQLTELKEQVQPPRRVPPAGGDRTVASQLSLRPAVPP